MSLSFVRPATDREVLTRGGYVCQPDEISAEIRNYEVELTLLGALVASRHLRRPNLDFLDR